MLVFLNFLIYLECKSSNARWIRTQRIPRNLSNSTIFFLYKFTLCNLWVCLKRKALKSIEKNTVKIPDLSYKFIDSFTLIFHLPYSFLWVVDSIKKSRKAWNIQQPVKRHLLKHYWFFGWIFPFIYWNTALILKRSSRKELNTQQKIVVVSPINQPIERSINWSIDKSISQLINQSSEETKRKFTKSRPMVVHFILLFFVSFFRFFYDIDLLYSEFV